MVRREPLSGEPRTGSAQLEDLKHELTGRQLAVLDSVASLRLMTGAQVQLMHFSDETGTPLGTGRTARHSLQRLTDERLLVRLQRRVGGTRAGSGSYVYALGPVGHRLLQRREARRRYQYREPSPHFVAHTLAVAQVVVDLTIANRRKELDILTLQTEPRCWRRTADAGGGPGVLRPDLFVALGVADFEHRWFVEADLGSEHVPTLLNKCRAYDAYYRAGTEQAEHGVFPRVLWLMHDGARANALSAAVEGDERLNPRMFVVTTADRALPVMTGDEP